jgi:hypothetical protein
MDRKQFPFEPDGPVRVEITLPPKLEEVQVFVDGALVHTFFGGVTFMRGAAIALPDGTELTVRMRGFLGIDVRRDGKPLPGSAMDRVSSLRAAGQMMLLVGATSLALDLEHLLHYPRGFPRTYAVLETIGDLAFVGLALLTRRGARWALGLAVVTCLGGLALRWQTNRGLFTLLGQLLLFAFLARHFAATDGKARPLARDAGAFASRKKRANDLGWPSRDDSRE